MSQMSSYMYIHLLIYNVSQISLVFVLLPASIPSAKCTNYMALNSLVSYPFSLIMDYVVYVVNISTTSYSASMYIIADIVGTHAFT